MSVGQTSDHPERSVDPAEPPAEKPPQVAAPESAQSTTTGDTAAPNAAQGSTAQGNAGGEEPAGAAQPGIAGAESAGGQGAGEAAPAAATGQPQGDQPEGESSPDTASQRGRPESSDNASQAAPPRRGPLALGRGPLAIRSAGAKPGSPAAQPQQGGDRAGKRRSKQRPAAAGDGPRQLQPQGSSKPGSPAAEAQSPAPASSAPSAPPSPGSHVPAPADDPPAPEAAPAAAAEKQPQGPAARPPKAALPPKAKVPSVRAPLSRDLQDELERELAGASQLDSFLAGSAGMADRSQPLEEGQRVQGAVLKIHEDHVFVALGGPDEGVVPLEQFEIEPTIGSSVEVVVRGINPDGLYQLTLPGGTISVADWSDIEPGGVVEVTVTGANSGGLECTVSGISGFIPISQISEFRVEDTSEFIGQKLVCVVTEANHGRGNLVVSRRAVLQRERQERRREQLERIEVGDVVEGTVRSVKDFGAFVDLGALEGMIHISKLSWDRIKHPSEVVEPGQRIKVKVDKVDKQTGKISLSYRDLLVNPWDAACETLAPGGIVEGTVTRIADFGAFVRIAAGVEGLVHISEIANHRVTNVGSFLSEGQQLQVKVLSVDREAQKISLSIKQAASQAASEASSEVTAEEEIQVRQPEVRQQHSGPLKGGNNRSTGGERFGLRW